MDHYFELLFALSNHTDHFLQKTNPDCNFTHGFEKLENNDTSTNDKHVSGKETFTLVISTLLTLFIGSAIILYIYKYPLKSKKVYSVLLFIGLVLIVLSIVLLIVTLNKLISEPIELIYPLSYFIARSEKNPPYLKTDEMNEYFPAHVEFENPENFRKLREESLRVIETSAEKLTLTGDTFRGNNAYIGSDRNGKKGWKIFMVKAGNMINPDARKICPFLVSLVEKEPSIKSCLYSVLEGDKEIPIHIGYYKGLLRYHIALVVPKDKVPFICVNGERYEWKEGEGMLFDDTYAHKVYNTSKDTRIIIYMDIERKIKNTFLAYLNRNFIDLVSNSSAVKDEVKRTEVQI